MVTARITEGVFFTTPPDLPRGRHELSRDDVLTAQRERLMIATTELMADSGYQGVGVRQIAKRQEFRRPRSMNVFLTRMRASLLRTAGSSKFCSLVFAGSFRSVPLLGTATPSLISSRVI